MNVIDKADIIDTNVTPIIEEVSLDFQKGLTIKYYYKGMIGTYFDKELQVLEPSEERWDIIDDTIDVVKDIAQIGRTSIQVIRCTYDYLYIQYYSDVRIVLSIEIGDKPEMDLRYTAFKGEQDSSGIIVEELANRLTKIATPIIHNYLNIN